MSVLEQAVGLLDGVEGYLEFLEEQPEDLTYDATAPDGCWLAHYLAERGYPGIEVNLEELELDDDAVTVPTWALEHQNQMIAQGRENYAPTRAGDALRMLLDQIGA